MTAGQSRPCCQKGKRGPPLYGDRSGGGRSTAGIGGTCHGTGMTYCRYWLVAARSHEFVHWENIRSKL